MSNNFQETVNLRDKMKRAKKESASADSLPAQTGFGVTKEEKPAEIDKLYVGKNKQEAVKKNLQKINRPIEQRKISKANKITLIIVVVILVIFTFLYFNRDETKNEILQNEQQETWYSIKLVDKNIYYGQVADISSDPVVAENVYYDYDQIKNDEEPSEIGKLRLVKRGKETHGPEGTMNIVRSQILFMEPLSNDSKVLEAIMNNENSNQ